MNKKSVLKNVTVIIIVTISSIYGNFNLFSQEKESFEQPNLKCSDFPKNYTDYVKEVYKLGFYPEKTKVISIEKPRKLQFNFNFFKEESTRRFLKRMHKKSLKENNIVDKLTYCVYIIKYKYSYMHQFGDVFETNESILLYNNNILFRLEEEDTMELWKLTAPE